MKNRELSISERHENGFWAITTGQTASANQIIDWYDEQDKFEEWGDYVRFRVVARGIGADWEPMVHCEMSSLVEATSEPGLPVPGHGS